MKKITIGILLLSLIVLAGCKFKEVVLQQEWWYATLTCEGEPYVQDLCILSGELEQAEYLITDNKPHPEYTGAKFWIGGLKN